VNQNAPRALVVGGSLGGLFAAHLLRGAGWNASVFERNEEGLTGRGVGLGTHPQLIAILRRAGVAFDGTMGTMSGWPRLYQALRDALPAQTYRLGKRLHRRTGQRWR
jgi:2-polyprenyl-6-methoxyphenol hydroxylase-like FAD-dependent oxidoreductase